MGWHRPGQVRGPEPEPPLALPPHCTVPPCESEQTGRAPASSDPGPITKEGLRHITRCERKVLEERQDSIALLCLLSLGVTGGAPRPVHMVLGTKLRGILQSE